MRYAGLGLSGSGMWITESFVEGDTQLWSFDGTEEIDETGLCTAAEALVSDKVVVYLMSRSRVKRMMVLAVELNFMRKVLKLRGSSEKV